MQTVARSPAPVIPNAAPPALPPARTVRPGTPAATVPAAADGTILRYGFSGDFFKLIAEQVPAPTPEMDEKAAKDAERGRKIIQGMGEKIDHMDVRAQLTARGIEFVQTNSLK